MLKEHLKILIVILVINPDCFGQEADAGAGFQMMVMNNPAFSGSEGDGILRLSYLNYFPGNNYNLHSVYCSYDSYFPGLHGGAGFYLSDDYQGGVVNDLRGGLSYAYFLQAGRDLYINAGLSASFYHRGFNFGEAILPDQIDPLGYIAFTSSEALSNKGRTVFDIGAGFLFVSGKFFGGFSINHLAEPNLSSAELYNSRLKRNLLVHVSGDFDLNKARSLIIKPILLLSLQEGYSSGGLGAAIGGNTLAINAIILADNSNIFNIQTGFSFRSNIIGIYYNYRFNIISGNKFMPLSLIHQTGLTISLNNVDKRNVIKTINYPQL